MLLQRDQSCLLLIDVQEKLTPHVKHADKLISRCQWLMRLARDLEVPLLVSEQYPRGLGRTVEPLQSLVQSEICIEKVSFSCLGEQTYCDQLKTIGKNQVVLIGIETHVCILQSALDMKKDGFDVFVVVDAVSSRHSVDHEYGLKRMRQAGIQLVTSEMVFFEWVGQAGTPRFKQLSKTYLQ